MEPFWPGVARSNAQQQWPRRSGVHEGSSFKMITGQSIRILAMWEVCSQSNRCCYFQGTMHHQVGCRIVQTLHRQREVYFIESTKRVSYAASESGPTQQTAHRTDPCEWRSANIIIHWRFSLPCLYISKLVQPRSVKA